MHYRHSSRTLILAGLIGLGSVCALAQTGTAAPKGTAPVEKKTEVITHEDKGSRIEELRVGGETKRIDVETKSGVPGYQIQPPDAGSQSDNKGTAGKSSWRVLKF